MTATAPSDPQTALESLAAALDPGEFITTLVTGTARPRRNHPDATRRELPEMTR